MQKKAFIINCCSPTKCLQIKLAPNCRFLFIAQQIWIVYPPFSNLASKKIAALNQGFLPKLQLRLKLAFCRSRRPGANSAEHNGQDMCRIWEHGPKQNTGSFLTHCTTR